MPNKTPNTKKHVVQQRGRQDSETYNQNSEDIYQDLVYLFNKANELNSDIDEGYSAITKDIRSIGIEISTLEATLASLNSSVAPKTVFLTGPEMRDDDRFEGTAYAIPAANRLTYDNRFNTYSLPKNANSSISRLAFYDSDGNKAIPPSLEMVVVPDASSSDKGDSYVRTSQPFEAVLGSPGKVWERNVSTLNDSTPAEMDLFFTLPADLTSTEYANAINLVPFPMFGVDILAIYYTTEAYPDLSTTGSVWTPLNKDAIYNGNPSAVGYVPPGAWSGDEILNAGPLSFVFPPEKITAMRITIRQRNPYNLTEDIVYPKFLYSYGLSYLDVRYEKFDASGKAIFMLTPKVGDTISSITSVQPYIYNTTQAGLPDVFSYRVLWETFLDSGVFTTTPVPLSSRVFLETTLTKDAAGNLPVLTGFQVVYS